MRGGYVPEMGDCVWLDFPDKSGHEQKGRRAALVLSEKDFNATGMMFCCPLTTQVKGYPFEVALPAKCQAKGVVLASHLQSVDWRSRRADYFCKIPRQAVEETMDKIKAIMSI